MDFFKEYIFKNWADVPNSNLLFSEATFTAQYLVLLNYVLIEFWISLYTAVQTRYKATIQFDKLCSARKPFEGVTWIIKWTENIKAIVSY